MLTEVLPTRSLLCAVRDGDDFPPADRIDIAPRVLTAFPEFVSINSDLRLARVGEEHVSSLFLTIANNKTRLSPNFPKTANVASPQELHRFIKDDKDGNLYLVVLACQSALGMLYAYVEDSNSIEISYWLDRHHTGVGIMTRSVDILTQFFLAIEPGLTVSAYVNEKNPASENVLRRCHFKKNEANDFNNAVDQRWERRWINMDGEEKLH